MGEISKKDGCLMRYKDKKKICFAASSGGHYEQLMMLKPLIEEEESFILTEKTQYKSSDDSVKSYYMKQINRGENTFIIKLMINVAMSLGIYIKERPDIVICTGVLAMIPMCLITKIFGGKLIYIESFAKVTSPTMTGKLLYKYADRFYIQWESLREFYPKAIYLGGIY